MTPLQRDRAIELLANVTEVDVEIIEQYEDYALDAWCGELGYEWSRDEQCYVSEDWEGDA